jgi:hypothetical protein
MSSAHRRSAAAQVYITPEIEKRPDELCPSLLTETYSSTEVAKEPAELMRSYETNSRYLSPLIRDLKDNSLELEYIYQSIDNTLKAIVDEEQPLSKMHFQPKGCKWTMALNPNLGASDYRLRVTLLGRGAQENTTTFVVQTTLLNKVTAQIASSSEEGLTEAKPVFEQTALLVRKAVVKCDFPEFPEGGKARGFKEVYKLNAKVRIGGNLYLH